MARLREQSRTLHVSHVCGCLLPSRIVFDICSRQICLDLVVFQDEKSTEARCEAKMWGGSWWGSLWLIFPLATWQGEDKDLIMKCGTLMSLSSTDNTWSALLPFNLWYQWGKMKAKEGFASPAKTKHDFKNCELDACLWLMWSGILRTPVWLFYNNNLNNSES